jgi:tetratricopeptide (TPR) repeat protein
LAGSRGGDSIPRGPLLSMRIEIATLGLLAFRIFAQQADPASAARRAQELVAAHSFDEAIRIYHDLVRVSPENAALWLNLSVADYLAKHFREAITDATAALKLQPDLMPALLVLGGSYLELGQFAMAIDPLKSVLAANPRERNGRLMLAEALLGAGQPVDAADNFQAAAELLPDNPRVWYGLGRAQEALGKSTAAKEAWDRLISLPASLESHLHAAEVHRAGRRWREAAAEWREALRLAPEKSGIRLALGDALFRSRDYRDAMATLQPLLASENGDVLFLYGASLLNLLQPLAAIPYLKSAIARNDRLQPARAALGQALLQTGQPDEAIPLLAQAILVDEDGSTHFQLFRAYQLTHRDAEAKHALAEYQRFRASLPARP